jgi:antitoxin component YwqK of YwqJK toxin-antitoxin module
MKLDIPWLKKKASNQKKQNLRRNGPWREFNKHGILVLEGSYKDGVRVGKWKSYYETGELVMEENYVYGVMEGPFKSYYKNGQVLSEGHYIENKREGKFCVYHISGRLTKTMIFEDDVLVEELFEDGDDNK